MRALELSALTAMAAIVALQGGCATGTSPGNPPAPTGTPAQQQALARYLAYAGPPIPDFTWLGHFYSWEGLGKDTLVVFTVPDEAYLLKVWPPCDLRFVINAIGITSTAHTVYAHADSLTINSSGTGPGRWRCPIDEIRKIDYRRMRADQRAQAQQSKAAAEDPAAPPASPATPPGPSPH
ncbi:MAG TPA: DUF6491 family protein [Steroidobacteraceae bacterium]|nr:DUF6491 family protein [Steroidobacteraceae bacterium]